MIWALIFTLFFGENEPVFILPKLEKYVRQNIEDKSRKDRILELRKISKKNRKKQNKYKSKTYKQFQKLNLSTTSTLEDFNALMNAYSEKRDTFQNEEIKNILEAKSLISDKEWTQIVDASYKDIRKQKKEIDKRLQKHTKHHIKTLALIESAIHPKYDSKKIDTVVSNIYSSYKKYVLEYHNLLENQNSILYRHNTTERELRQSIAHFNELHDAIYLSIIKGHFDLLQTTTNRDWKKILKRTNKL
jgi:hypothetical protein